MRVLDETVQRKVSQTLWRNFLALGFVLVASFSIAQCDVISLRGQKEVDQFNVLYGNCSVIGRLTISPSVAGQVLNVDSLYKVTRIETLNMFGLEKLHSVNGLRNVEYIGKFTTEAFNEIVDSSSFSSLDTLLHLEYGGDTIFRNSNFQVFDSVKFLEKLKVSDFDNMFKIENAHIRNSIKDLIVEDFLDTVLLSNLVSGDKLVRVRMTNDRYPLVVRLDHALQTSEIEELFVFGRSVEESVLHWNKDLTVRTLYISDLTWEERVQLTQIDTIKDVVLHNVQGIDTLSKVFGDIRHFSSLLELDSLLDLREVGLDLQTLPNEDYDRYHFHHITITNNPQLDYCSDEFLCKAVTTYPEEVLLENNGQNCTQDYLLNNCMLSISNLEHESNLWFPNPTSGQLFLQKQGTYQAKILATDGRVVHQLTISNGEPVDLSLLPDGVYLIQLTSKDNLANRTLSRIVKY